MGLHLGHDPNTLYAKYTDQTVETFEGVTIDELQKVETLFEVNIIVYKLSDASAQLVRRSLSKHANTYMKRTSPSFMIIRGIVVHIDAASVSIRCGNVRPGWIDTN